ncbi:MAG: ABC transporter ATP-binding protein [Candidatus Zixiibacteriota bacterium]|nr:MAG: ABC transporter ATP-binding protein [candidate division Zixibacteria bacterium]
MRQTVNEQPTRETTLRLEAVNLTKRYEDGVLALDHINFAVQSGELFVMLGGNGAGKTTAINLFLNFLEPTEGEARINGIASHREPLKAKQHVAFVSENVMLYGNFTAIQNLDFFARIGGKTDFRRNDYRDVLLRVGLPEDVHDKRLKSFSKGMRQKCGIAIAILKDASAILLDEPTAGLDPKAGHEFVRLLDSLRSEGKAVFMSTHDIFRAREIADTFAILDRGRIIMQEPASNLAGKDLETLYIQYMAGHNNSSVAAAGGIHA